MRLEPPARRAPSDRRRAGTCRRWRATRARGSTPSRGPCSGSRVGTIRTRVTGGRAPRTRRCSRGGRRPSPVTSETASALTARHQPFRHGPAQVAARDLLRPPCLWVVALQPLAGAPAAPYVPCPGAPGSVEVLRLSWPLRHPRPRMPASPMGECERHVRRTLPSSRTRPSIRHYHVPSKSGSVGSRPYETSITAQARAGEGHQAHGRAA